jgi:regulator of replication initiation timing
MKSLFDLTRELLIESGGTPIFKERISLIQDKAAEFERKLRLSESEVVILGSENTDLQSENADLRAENTSLKERLKEFENSSHNNLHKNEMALLITLYRGDAKTATELASSPGIDEQKVLYHLEELRNKGLVYSQVVPIAFAELWDLSHEGRKYLIKRNVV